MVSLLVVTASSAFSQEEESVNFGEEAALESGRTVENPYEFTRSRIWLALPLGVLAFASLHLIAYPYLRVKKQKLNLESKRNDS